MNIRTALATGWDRLCYLELRASGLWLDATDPWARGPIDRAYLANAR